MPTLALPLMVLLVALTRLVPHPPNFAAVGALALFAGYTSRSALGLVFPLIALLTSDILGHLLGVPGMGFYGIVGMGTVYGSFFLVALIGRATVTQTARARNRAWVVSSLAASSVAGATVFFLVSNFGVFLGGMYPPTWSGLAACYLAALPFFTNTLAGDLFYSLLLFGTAWSLGKVNRNGLTRPDLAVLAKFAE